MSVSSNKINVLHFNFSKKKEELKRDKNFESLSFCYEIKSN